MNLQEIQAIALAVSTEELIAPDEKFAQAVSLSEEELAEALLKGDTKSEKLLAETALPEEEALKHLVMELIALNREIEPFPQRKSTEKAAVCRGSAAGGFSSCVSLCSFLYIVFCFCTLTETVEHCKIKGGSDVLSYAIYFYVRTDTFAAVSAGFLP